MAFDPTTAQELDLTPDVLRTLGPTPQPEQDTPPAPTAFDPSSAVEIDVPDEVILHEQSGKNVQVPPTLNGNEADFVVKKNVEKADPSRFWGIVDLGMQAFDTVSNPTRNMAEAAQPYVAPAGRGLANFLTTALPKMAAGNLQEFGERGAANAREAIPSMLFPNVYTAEGLAGAETYDKLAASGQRLRAGVESWAKDHGLERPADSEGTAKQFMYDLGGGLGSVATAIGMTLFTRNPLAASFLFGNMQKAESYVEARNKEFSPEAAGSYSTVQGMVNGMLEAVGNGLFQHMAELSTPLRRIAMRAVEEASQEGLQQAAEETIANTADVRDTPLQEGLKNVAYAALIGGLSGAPVASVVELAERNNVPVDQAQRVVDSINAQQPEAVEAANAMLHMGVNGLARDAKLEAESAEIIRKFQTGEPIDLTPAMTIPPAQINAAPLEKRLAKRLEEVGLDKEQATSNAALVRAAYETLSNRYGAAIQPAIDAEFNKLEIGDSNVLDQGALTQQAKTVTQTPEFKNWFGDSKVRDETGEPLVVYHGTTANFEAFDRSKANVESDVGSGFYFTNEPEDVGANYAGEGPDLTKKIQTTAERIASETDREYDDPDVIAEARAQFVENKGSTVPVYLSFKNPVELGGDNETRFEMTQEFDEEGDPTGDESGPLVDLLDAIDSVAGDFSADAGQIRYDIMSNFDGESVSASDVFKAIKEGEGGVYAEDPDTGQMASGELFRAVMEYAGFDGIIDRTVDDKFGSSRQKGQKMKGVNPDTVHYIAFKPEQIKSVFNRGTFDPADPRILYQGNEPARPRGVRGSISLRPNQALVRLFDERDASTFLHETGHFYWETLNALSQQKNAPKALRDDVQVLRDWVGATGTEPLTVDQHEKIARGVEAYLMEGRAPSLRLADVFEKFRQWLRDIYKTVKALRADVSPEVQAVLDRLFATDEEMQQVRTAAVAEEALGRLRWLDRQIGALDVQMDDLDRLMQEREAAGKPNVANARSMERLQAQRDVYDQERAEILTNEGTKNAFEFATSNDGRMIEIKAGRLKRLAEEALDAKRRALEQGLREGRAMARQDVAAAQRLVVDTIQDSGLTAKDKAKFLDTLKTLQTSDQLEKMLPRIQARIGTLLEREAQRRAKDKLVALLKKTKPTKQGGKPKGRFTPEIQDLLDRLRELATLKAGEAQARLDARLAAYANDEPPSATEALENQVLAVMADRDAVPSAEIEDAVASVTDLLREGKLGAAERLAARAERLADLKMMARTALENQGDRKLVDRTTLNERARAWGREVRGGAYMVQQDWHGLLNLVFGKDRTSGDELINQLGQGISEGFQNRKGIVRRATEDMTERMKKAFGFAHTREALKQIKADEKLLDVGTFVNAAGDEVRLQMTKAQARKRWMEMQDPTLMETITDPNGNAYTPAMIEAVEDMLTPQDIAFANAQLDFYRDFYRQVNEVYSEVYGLNLPHNPFYSPISRRHSKEDVTDTFHGEQNFRRSASAGSLKSRVKTKSALRDLSDMETLQRHIAQMAHFIAFQEKLQEVNVVLSDNKVRDEIKDRFGTNVLTALDETRNDFGRGQIRYIKEGLDSFESLRQRFSTAMLGLKPALAVKNMTQFVVYGEKIPTTDFIAGIADFLKNPVKAARTLSDSEMLKARGTDLNRDVALALKSGEFGRFAENPRLTNALLWFTQAGDKAAVMMGGWAVYRHAIKQGKTHEQALRAFEQATSESQQTSDLDRMSRLELSSNVLGRTLTMFMSGQNRAYRREVKAGLDFARGKISAGDAAKVIALYHFVLPMFYQFVADFFTWDDENQARAALWGSLNGLFIVWDALDAVGRYLTGERYFEKTMPTFEFMYKILDSLASLGDAIETDDPDDWYKAIKDGVTGIGLGLGLPFNRAFDVYEGMEIFDEAPLSGAARILGWPKSVGNALAEEENAAF